MCVTAETNVLQIPCTRHTIYSVRKVSCCPMCDLAFLLFVRDSYFETLLVPNQARRRNNQTIHQRINLLAPEFF
jgi:hypothetical protein